MSHPMLTPPLDNMMMMHDVITEADPLLSEAPQWKTIEQLQQQQPTITSVSRRKRLDPELINVEVNQDEMLEQFLSAEPNEYLQTPPHNQYPQFKRGNSCNSYDQFSPRSHSSEDVEFAPPAKKCMTKSAIAARENRQKKKQKVGLLEQNVHELSTENIQLKGSVNTLSKKVTSLQSEVQYLKSIIANQSTLSSLLQQIPLTPSIRLSTSFSTDNTTMQTGNGSLKRKAQSQHDHGYATGRSVKQQKDNSGVKAAGVCLHVSGASVSLEFCAACNSKATSSSSSDKITVDI